MHWVVILTKPLFRRWMSLRSLRVQTASGNHVPGLKKHKNLKTDSIGNWKTVLSLGEKQGNLDVSAASGRRERAKRKSEGHALGIKGQKSRLS